MSLLYMASFDTGDSPASFARWTSAPTAPTINTTNPRFTGANAWTVGNPNIGGVDTFRQGLGAGADDVVIVGFAVRYEGALSGDNTGGKGLIVLYGDTFVTQHITMGVAADGSIVVRRGAATGTSLGASAAGVIALNVWNYIELKVKLHDTTGTVDVHVNGASVISATGLDTKNGGTAAVFDTVEFGGGGVSATTRMRDIYICNEVGSVNNNFRGDCRVSVVLPDADSTPEEFTLSTGTNSSALIDETTPNGDTDYIESDIDGEITRVGLSALADTTHTIFGLQTVLYAKKDDAGAKSVRVGLFSDASTQNLPDHVLGTSYATLLDISELDPDGSIPWTPTQLNAAFVQVEVRP